ncbi:MAG TPA: hypothetical protein DCL54_18765 [Alphaproteobacteria bacterium]|nr:hypothetical protein [Alphaproteobacteria bacterium]HAJ48626.1 hypothetical protein [Alphaproteobacteria bacterium]
MAPIIDPLVARALHALQGGDLGLASSLAAERLTRNPNEPTCLMIAGLAAHARGQLSEALEYLLRADQVAPRNPMILTNLGVVFRAVGRFGDARAAYETALAVNGGHIPTRMNLARLLDQMGELTSAQAHYREVLRRSSDNPEALGGLAAVMEQQHELDEAKSLAERAMARQPSALAGLTLAKIAVRERDAPAALSRLAQLWSAPMSAVNTALALGLEGQALDLQGQYDAAFAAFARANGVLRRLHAAAYAGVPSIASSHLLREIKDFVASCGVTASVDTAASPVASHVFLVGFPRSGTTLLEQALAAHPAIETLEERDTLGGAFQVLIESGSVPLFFASLDATRRDRLRADYWDRVAAALGRMPARPVFIDKMPINSAYMAMISAIFPNARYIFAVRDPRDVVLSCFQQRFGMNAVMFRLLDLREAATLYDETMQAAHAAMAQLTLPVHRICYERLVEDFEGQMRALFAFLGLGWSPEVLAYRQTARTRVIATPSAAQVVEPLSDRSIGKWRRYQTHMAPVLPVLRPWVEHFGYDLGPVSE